MPPLGIWASLSIKTYCMVQTQSIEKCWFNIFDEFYSGQAYKELWNKYRGELLELLEVPEINIVHQIVIESGTALLRRVEELIEGLVEIRRQLSMQYDVPPES